MLLIPPIDVDAYDGSLDIEGALCSVIHLAVACQSCRDAKTGLLLPVERTLLPDGLSHAAVIWGIDEHLESQVLGNPVGLSTPSSAPARGIMINPVGAPGFPRTEEFRGLL